MRISGLFLAVTESIRPWTALLPLSTLLVCATLNLSAQQRVDTSFDPPVPNPAYPAGKGPVIAIDEAHQNSHTVEGGYSPFAKLLRKDGYRVQAFKSKFAVGSLR